ncbi:hypothetical protein F2P81_001210 [Scophthalmus maximus]|uniref:Uncharacterized protein n=1 Tax=Scophthalmus maximus TaxID=52904 RepID=A0A6A4TL19_SCOMX|nr:hypothetical protein F2P81_001210 [Scophthalmus maximus]
MPAARVTPQCIEHPLHIVSTACSESWRQTMADHLKQSAAATRDVKQETTMTLKIPSDFKAPAEPPAKTQWTRSSFFLSASGQSSCQSSCRSRLTPWDLVRSGLSRCHATSDRVTGFHFNPEPEQFDSIGIGFIRRCKVTRSRMRTQVHDDWRAASMERVAAAHDTCL